MFFHLKSLALRNYLKSLFWTFWPPFFKEYSQTFILIAQQWVCFQMYSRAMSKMAFFCCSN